MELEPAGCDGVAEPSARGGEHRLRDVDAVDPARTTVGLVQPAEEIEAQPAAETDVGQHGTRAHRHGGDGGLEGRGIAPVEHPADEPAEPTARVTQLPGEGSRPSFPQTHGGSVGSRRPPWVSVGRPVGTAPIRLGVVVRMTMDGFGRP